jgi:hypothetical protein
MLTCKFLAAVSHASLSLIYAFSRGAKLPSSFSVSKSEREKPKPLEDKEETKWQLLKTFRV